jgi:hypothetical protein
MKYQLKRAIELAGAEQPIVELNLREKLSAGDLRGIKLAALGDLGEMKTEDMLKIIGRLSGRTDPEMNALAPEDLGEIVMLVQGFFSPGSSATKPASDSSTSTPPSAS